MTFPRALLVASVLFALGYRVGYVDGESAGWCRCRAAWRAWEANGPQL